MKLLKIKKDYSTQYMQEIKISFLTEFFLLTTVAENHLNLDKEVKITLKVHVYFLTDRPILNIRQYAQVLIFYVTNSFSDNHCKTESGLKEATVREKEATVKVI